MKKLSLLAIFFFFFFCNTSSQSNKNANITATPGILTVTATEGTAGGGYSPKHCTAVWIQDANGLFVKTLLVYAKYYRTHLNFWESATTASGSPFNTVDAISGATVNNYATITCSWNGTNVATPAEVLPDGIYTVKMELTDKNGTGNLATFTFTKGPKPVTLTPADQPSFSNVILKWVPM